MAVPDFQTLMLPLLKLASDGQQHFVRASLDRAESFAAALTRDLARCAALKEMTRERVPLQWATSTGNQGVALMLLAERRGDAEMAELAVQQIEAALTTSRDAGDAPSAAYYEAQLPKARAIRDWLKAP